MSQLCYKVRIKNTDIVVPGQKTGGGAGTDPALKVDMVTLCNAGRVQVPAKLDPDSGRI